MCANRVPDQNDPLTVHPDETKATAESATDSCVSVWSRSEKLPLGMTGAHEPSVVFTDRRAPASVKPLRWAHVWRPGAVLTEHLESKSARGVRPIAGDNFRAHVGEFFRPGQWNTIFVGK